jgi:hypothetical protein
MEKLKINLRLFDGEGGSAAAGSSGPAGEGGSKLVPGTQANGLIVNDSQGTSQDFSQGQVAAVDAGTDFDNYMNSHKDEADKWFSDRFQEKFNKRYAPIKKQLSAANTVMEMLATKYGIEDSKDIEAITKALEEDDMLYAERAEANGRSIDEQREWDKLEQENRIDREQRQQMERSEQIRRQMEEWDRQSTNLKQLFPTFNLDVELQNPDFEQALRSGLSMERAFYAVHGEEIFSGAMQNTAQAVREATAQDLAARSKRPKENAIGSNASAKVSKDVHKLTNQERAEIAQRSMGGAIRF